MAINASELGGRLLELVGGPDNVVSVPRSVNAARVFGAPTWEPAIPFKVVQEKVGRGRMLKLDIV